MVQVIALFCVASQSRGGAQSADDLTCTLKLSKPRALLQVWVAKQDEQGRCIVAVHSPPSDEPAPCLEPLPSCVTCMDCDDSGRVWMGHMDGSVSARGREGFKALCPALKAFTCPVT